jgi:hypothetical protein
MWLNIEERNGKSTDWLNNYSDVTVPRARDHQCPRLHRIRRPEEGRPRGSDHRQRRRDHRAGSQRTGQCCPPQDADIMAGHQCLSVSARWPVDRPFRRGRNARDRIGAGRALRSLYLRHDRRLGASCRLRHALVGGYAARDGARRPAAHRQPVSCDALIRPGKLTPTRLCPAALTSLRRTTNLLQRLHLKEKLCRRYISGCNPLADYGILVRRTKSGVKECKLQIWETSFQF